MAANGNPKLKTLYLMQILQEETDADHGLSMRELIDRLEAYGIKSERKSIYRDIGLLRDFGLDIKTYQRNPVEYAIERRDFTLQELMLLVDAVESCKFLTKKQSRALTTNLKLMASDHQREFLDRSIHVEGRISSKNDSVFGFIDLIHEAIRRRRKVLFKYYKIDIDGNRYATHRGIPHEVTPVGIAFSDGYYYLTAWSNKYHNMTEFRIDRMDDVCISENTAEKNSQISRHSFEEGDHVSFGRFNGEKMTVTLCVDSEKVEIIRDKFGDAAQIYRNDDDTANAIVKIRKSEQFFGWIAGMGGAIRIAGPSKLKDEYMRFLSKLIEIG